MHMYVYGTSQCVSIRKRIFMEIKSVHFADCRRPSVYHKHTDIFERILRADLTCYLHKRLLLALITSSQKYICIFYLTHIRFIADVIEIKC